VQPLTDGQRELLEQTMHEDPSFRARSRAHGLLLRAAGTTIKAIAKTYQVHGVPVSTWIKNWEQQGVQSWHDQPRSGRPSQLTLDEQAIAQHYIKEAPRSLTGMVERFARTTEKRLSLSTLKRLATKARLRWKRVSKSLKKRREPDAFAHCQRELAALQKQEDQLTFRTLFRTAEAIFAEPFVERGAGARYRRCYAL